MLVGRPNLGKCPDDRATVRGVTNCPTWWETHLGTDCAPPLPLRCPAQPGDLYRRHGRWQRGVPVGVA